MSGALPLVSFKLRFVDVHARAVPATDAQGCAFAGPGVDVLGAEARALFVLARPVLAWFELREPGITPRSLSVDLVKHRVVLTIDDPTLPRPRVVRVDDRSDAAGAHELIALAAPVVLRLGEIARDSLAARRPQSR